MHAWTGRCRPTRSTGGAAGDRPRPGRGAPPAPGAGRTGRGDRVRLGPVEPLPEVDLGAPGELEVGPEGVLVGTGRGAVRLGNVQPAGKRMFPAAAGGRGARPQLGERVGE